MPQQQTSSSPSPGAGDDSDSNNNDGDDNDNDNNRISEIRRRYPENLLYQNVVIKYELDPSENIPLQLQDASYWNNEIDYENQTMRTEMMAEQDIDNHYYISLIKFAQPVKFKSARIIYGLESVDCAFHKETGTDATAMFRPGSPATFDSSSEETGVISCRTERQEIYSEL